MRLSEAIRLGSLLRPQTKHGYFYAGGSCALGAAAEAAGWDLAKSVRLQFIPDLTAETVVEFLEQHFGLLKHMTTHPDNSCLVNTVAGVVILLNDYSGWSREQIADWVAEVEKATEAEAVQPATEAEVAESEAVLV